MTVTSGRGVPSLSNPSSPPAAKPKPYCTLPTSAAAAPARVGWLASAPATELAVMMPRSDMNRNSIATISGRIAKPSHTVAHSTDVTIAQPAIPTRINRYAPICPTRRELNIVISAMPTMLMPKSTPKNCGETWKYSMYTSGVPVM